MPREFLPLKRDREARTKALKAPFQDRMMRGGERRQLVSGEHMTQRHLRDLVDDEWGTMEPLKHITD